MSYSWRDRAIFLAARLLLKALASTWRVSEEVPDDCRGIVSGSEIAVIAFWHGRMLPAWYRFRHTGKAALVSASRDGEILAGYLEKSLGYAKVIRGSSSRNGSEALGEMVAVLRDRSCLITPDGPRGPAEKGKPGALIAAGRSARPVLCVGWHCTRSWRLKSWDAMEVPKPFTKVVFRYCRIETLTNKQQRTQQEDRDRGESLWIEDEDLQDFEKALSRLAGG